MCKTGRRCYYKMLHINRVIVILKLELLALQHVFLNVDEWFPCFFLFIHLAVYCKLNKLNLKTNSHLHLTLPPPCLFFLSFTLSISNLQSFLTLSFVLTEMWNLHSPSHVVPSFSFTFYISLSLFLSLARTHTHSLSRALTVIARLLFLLEWQPIAVWHQARRQQRWGGENTVHIYISRPHI